MSADPDELLRKCPKCHQEDRTSFSTCRYCSALYESHQETRQQSSLLENIVNVPIQSVLVVFGIVSILCAVYVSQSLKTTSTGPKMIWGAHGEVPAIPAAIITFFGSRVINDASQSIEKQNEILEKNPGDYGALVARGDGYWTKGMMPQALTDYSSAINADPDIPRAYEKRALIYDAMGNYDRSKTDRETAEKLKNH
jgi:tetratricopeptide (TPR) repeat protein